MQYPRFALLLPVVLGAELATDYTGDRLLLASPWKLSGSANTASPAAVYLFRDGQWSAVAGADGYVAQPAISADGRLATWERYRPCMGGSCGFIVLGPRSATEGDSLPASLRIARYSLRFSPNARFVVTPGFLTFQPWALQDLETGTVWTDAVPLVNPSGVSDNGTVIGTHQGQAAVWRPGGGIVHLMPTPQILFQEISANSAAALVEEGSLQAGRTLFLIDIASRTRRAISYWPPYSGPGPVSIPLGRKRLSDDGTRALLYQAPYLKLYDAGEMRQLLEIPEDLLHLTLSGSGRVGYVLTTLGRLLRVDTDSGAAEELASLPLRVSQVPSAAVTGSAFQLRMHARTDGLRIRIDGFEFPRVDTDEPGGVFLQVPWEFPAGENGATYPVVVTRDGSPFEITGTVTLRGNPWASFAWRGQPYEELKAVQEDWSDLVTETNPAAAGTTIHTYMFGLGRLDRAVATGEPGPDSPPARPLASMACYIRGDENNPPPRGVELPFIAYAPGLVGVYQVDITIPSNWPAGRALINCEGAGYTGGWVWTGPAPARLPSN
jgi:uncharacterized protein (TIGR03437 family)